MDNALSTRTCGRKTFSSACARRSWRRICSKRSARWRPSYATKPTGSVAMSETLKAPRRTSIS
eukprot:2985508-Prorocentrum_lima.AAC.1